MIEGTPQGTPGANRATQDRLKNLRANNLSKTAQRAERATERVVASIAEPNHSALRQYVLAKRAAGCKPQSVLHTANALAYLHAEAAGTAFAAISPDLLTTILERHAATHSPATTSQWAGIVRGYYKWLHDDELPKAIRRALKRQHKAFFRDVQPVTDEEFARLLAAVDEGAHRRNVAKHMALLWMLWDSGFRVSEALSLQIQDLTFDGRAGVRIHLKDRLDMPDLKTGPREVYCVDCSGALRVWLQYHPAGDEPEAPVFPSYRDPMVAAWPNGVNKLLDQFTKRAGLRRINPHLFRHTRATRAARQGWNEPQMRAYFGWGPGSEMPSHYIHLAARDMEEQVRRDAGVDDMGRHVKTTLTEGDMDKMLKRTLRRIIESE